MKNDTAVSASGTVDLYFTFSPFVRGGIWVLFLLLIYFPLFLHLDSLSLRLWDEARRGVNAFEMLQSGNWLVVQYDGEPEMWGTKPPLLIWLQALTMKVLGPTELAVRLPSALAGLGTVLLLTWFGIRRLRRPWLGFLAGLILVTIPAYIETTHSARTGDFDSLLTLWLTGALLFFFCWVEDDDPKEQRRYAYLTVLFVTLGALTKGVAGLFFLPGMFLYTLFRGKLGLVLGSRETYVGIGAFLLVVGGYYLLREQYNPGYLQAVWENELGGRYLESNEGHNHPFGYYFEKLFETRMPYWIYFALLGIPVGLWQKEEMRKVTLLLTLNAMCLLLVISNSESKLAWYELPILPSLAFLAAVPVGELTRWINRRLKTASFWPRFTIGMILFLLCYFYPYSRAIEKVYHHEDRGHQWEMMQYSHFIEWHPDLKSYTLGVSGYNAHAEFYAQTFNQRGWDLRVREIRSGDRVEPGEEILYCDSKVEARLSEAYRFEVLEETFPCKLIRITSSSD